MPKSDRLPALPHPIGGRSSSKARNPRKIASPKRRALDPRQVLERAGACYVVGYCHKNAAPRTFRLDRSVRMAAVFSTHATFEIPRKTDLRGNLDTYLADAWTVFVGAETHDITLILARELQPLILNAEHHAGEKKKVIGGGKVEYRVRLFSLDEIEGWVAGFGVGCGGRNRTVWGTRASTCRQRPESSRPPLINNHIAGPTTASFPASSPPLERFGFKFSAGGAHISRTMMLEELRAVLAAAPSYPGRGDYRESILARNALGKSTDSTRSKSFRHLRELYSLDDRAPIFGLLRKLYALEAESLPLLALQVAWARDPLFRATTSPILEATEGERVETASLSLALEAAFSDQYSPASRDKIARNSASSWTQAGHLVGRTKKTRKRIKPTAVATTFALFLGHISEFHGAAVFSNPWCSILDLTPDRARSLGLEAHRAGLLDLRALGEIVEISFPLFAEFEERLQ